MCDFYFREKTSINGNEATVMPPEMNRLICNDMFDYEYDSMYNMCSNYWIVQAKPVSRQHFHKQARNSPMSMCIFGSSPSNSSQKQHSANAFGMDSEKMV